METLTPTSSEMLSPDMLNRLRESYREGVAVSEGMVRPDALRDIQGDLPHLWEGFRKDIKMVDKNTYTYPGYRVFYQALSLMENGDWQQDEDVVREICPHLMGLVDELGATLGMVPRRIQINKYTPGTMTSFHADKSSAPSREVFSIGLDGEGSFQLLPPDFWLPPKMYPNPARPDFVLDRAIPMSAGDAVAMTTEKVKTGDKYPTRYHAGVNDSDGDRTILVVMYGPPDIQLPEAA